MRIPVIATRLTGFRRALSGRTRSRVRNSFREAIPTMIAS